MTKKDLIEIVLAAAEQHGIDDPDDPSREVHDLQDAFRDAVKVMTKDQVERVTRSLEQRGMLAGWIE